MDRKIYLISSGEYYKIGSTKRDVEVRIKEFKTGNCLEFKIIHIFLAKDYSFSIEKSLHKHFKDKKENGEWFCLDKSDIDQFHELCEMFYDRYKALSTNTYLQDRGEKLN